MTSTTIIFDLIGRDGASKAFRSAAASAETAGARITSVGKKISGVGVSMTRGITMPAVAIGAVAVKMATDFSSAMTRIQTQAGASAKDVQVLSTQVLALGGKVQQTPIDLANALYHLKSVGLDNADAMKALAQSSHLASVGNASLEETTNAVAGAWRTGIKGATSFKGAVSTLNAIVGAGNMTMGDLNAALGTGFLASAKTFGLSLHDVGAALAVMTDEGVPAAAAATRLRMSFSLLAAPSGAASKTLDSVGISTDKLAHKLRDGGLVSAIGYIKDGLQGWSKVDQAQIISHAFGGGRSGAGIMSLINNFDVLKMKEAQVTAGMSKFGADVAKQAATPQAKLKMLESTLATLGVEIGDHLLPAVVNSAKGLENFLGWFDKLSPGVKKTTAEVALFLVALGPVLAIAGRLVMAYGLFVRLLGTIDVALGRTTASTVANTTATTAATDATKAQAAATEGLSGKMAGLRFAGAIAGLGLMAAGAKSSNDSIKTLTTVGGAALLGFSMGGPIGAAIGAGGGLLYSLYKNIQSSAAAAKAAKADYSGLGGTFDQLTGAITSNTRMTIENQLARSGALKSLAIYGITTRTAISAILGEGSARKVVTTAIDRQVQNYKALTSQIKTLEAAQKASGYDTAAGARGGVKPTGEQQARQAEINGLKQQAAAQKNAIDAVRKGIPAFKSQQQQLRRNIAATTDYSGKLKGLPKNVRTYVAAHGIIPTAKGIADIARRYHLMPKQVRTLIAAAGINSTVKAIESVKAKLSETDKSKANLALYQESLRAGAHTAAGLARDIGFGVKTQVEAGPAEAKANLSRFEASIKAAAINAKGIASTGGRSVGDALSAGVIAGFSSTSGLLAQQAAAAVQNAIAAARRAAGAHSPSRKMAQLGRDLMDGLLQGIASRQLSVQKAMQQIQGVIDNVGKQITANLSKITNLKNTQSGFLSTFTANSLFGVDLSHTTTDAAGTSVTTPETITDLIKYQKRQAHQAHRLMRDVNKVTGEGLSKALVRQLQSEGTSGAAALHALATGDPAQIRRLNRLNKQTSDSLHAAGMRAGNYVRGGSVNADIRLAQRQEHTLERQEHVLRDLEHRLKELDATLKKDQTITVKIGEEAIIRQIRRRNKRKGVKTAGV